MSKTLNRYTFQLTISGIGSNIEEAWDDAVELMSYDPDFPPDPIDIEEDVKGYI